QRNGLRAGRGLVRPVPEIRRQQGHQRRGRELFVRAARLCPALAGQCLERVRPHPPDRHCRVEVRHTQRKIVARPGPIRVDWSGEFAQIYPAMPATPVYIICSPRPQVGKTLLARLLSEFQLLKNGNVAAFDVNLKEPSLLDYLPKITETADVIDTYGKM